MLSRLPHTVLCTGAPTSSLRYRPPSARPMKARLDHNTLTQSPRSRCPMAQHTITSCSHLVVLANGCPHMPCQRRAWSGPVHPGLALLRYVPGSQGQALTCCETAQACPQAQPGLFILHQAVVELHSGLPVRGQGRTVFSLHPAPWAHPHAASLPSENPHAASLPSENRARACGGGVTSTARASKVVLGTRPGRQQRSAWRSTSCPCPCRPWPPAPPGKWWCTCRSTRGQSGWP